MWPAANRGIKAHIPCLSKLKRELVAKKTSFQNNYSSMTLPKIFLSARQVKWWKDENTEKCVSIMNTVLPLKSASVVICESSVPAQKPDETSSGMSDKMISMWCLPRQSVLNPKKIFRPDSIWWKVPLRVQPAKDINALAGAGCGAFKSRNTLRLVSKILWVYLQMPKSRLRAPRSRLNLDIRRHTERYKNNFLTLNAK